MLSTTITHQHTGYDYRMQVYYREDQDRWILSFSCLHSGVNHGKEIGCKSFKNALHKFNANCLYYGVPEQYCTEEQFLGLKEGTLYPKEAI